MPIITISRGSYSKGKEVAQKVAQKLGYECVSREIMLEASEEFHIPEIKLIRAVHDSPSILNRFTHGQERYIAYVKAALLGHFRKNNIVYHGLGGHFFVKGVSHVLKVRINADMEYRVRFVMEREGVTRPEAVNILEKDDAERKKWSRHLYGIDTADHSLYDLGIHIHKITADDAVDIISHTIGLKDFQTTPESQKAIDDLYLAAEVKAVLMDIGPEIEVSAQDGMVLVRTEAPLSYEQVLVDKIKKKTENIAEIKEIRVNVLPPTLYAL